MPKPTLTVTVSGHRQTGKGVLLNIIARAIQDYAPGSEIAVDPDCYFYAEKQPDGTLPIPEPLRPLCVVLRERTDCDRVPNAPSISHYPAEAVDAVVANAKYE